MIEYRIKPVTRYVVTRFHQSEPNEYGLCSGGCEQRGEFDHPDTAYQVGYALCKMEHEASREPVESMNFIYPTHPLMPAVPPAQPSQETPND